MHIEVKIVGKSFVNLQESTQMKITNFKKKKKLLTKEQQESNENAKIYYICTEKIENRYLKDKKYCKVRIIVIIQGI